MFEKAIEMMRAGRKEDAASVFNETGMGKTVGEEDVFLAVEILGAVRDDAFWKGVERAEREYGRA